MKNFLESYEIDKSNGPQKRIAKRFALAYAAGVFATKWKILPFNSLAVMNGISKCYTDTIKVFPKTDNQLAQEAFDTILRELKIKENFLDIRDVKHGYSYDDLQGAFGYISTVKGLPIRAIKSEQLVQLVLDKKTREMALEMFKQKGRLLLDADGKNTRQINWHLKSEYPLPRAYCFHVKSNPIGLFSQLQGHDINF